MDGNMTETEELAAVADQPEATDMAEPEGPHRSRRTVAVVAVVCAATASRITAKQVKDTATVDGLAEALKAAEPKVVACTADTKAGYETKAASIAKHTAWYRNHRKSLKAAVGRVNASKLDKAVDDASQLYKDSDGEVADAKTREELKRAIAAKDETRIAKAVKAVDDSVEAKRKADEEAARKKAEEEAEEEAEAQAAAEAAAAQAQQSYSGGSYSNTGGSQSYFSNTGGSASSGSAGSSNSGSSSSGGSSSAARLIPIRGPPTDLTGIM